MVVFMIITMVLMLNTDSFFKGFLGSIILFGLFNFWMPEKDHKVTETKTFIYSVSNMSNNIQGSFILGTGNINSSESYSYFIKNKDDSKEKKYIPTQGTKIFEEDNIKPFIKEKKCVDGRKFGLSSFIFMGVSTSTSECKKLGFNDNNALEHYQYEIHLPKNSIIQNFNLK